MNRQSELKIKAERRPNKNWYDRDTFKQTPTKLVNLSKEKEAGLTRAL